MFTDPLSVTYNSSSKTLPRVSQEESLSSYRTADGEFEILISSRRGVGGIEARQINLARQIPDPTPTNVFDNFRQIRNVFGLSYGFDTTRAETSVDIPLLRTALLALVDSTFQGRLITGEK